MLRNLQVSFWLLDIIKHMFATGLQHLVGGHLVETAVAWAWQNPVFHAEDMLRFILDSPADLK